MIFKLNLKKEFPIIPEGLRELEITEATLAPSGAPKQLILKLKDVETGATMNQSYVFGNEKSIFAMGHMVSAALDIADGGIFDTKDSNLLVGKIVECEIVHREYNGRKYANIKSVNKDQNKTEVTSNSTIDYSNL